MQVVFSFQANIGTWPWNGPPPPGGGGAAQKWSWSKLTQGTLPECFIYILDVFEKNSILRKSGDHPWGSGVGGPFHGHFSFQADWGPNHKKPFFLLGRGLLFDPKQQIICHVLSGRSLRYLYRSETFIFTFFQTCSLWQFCALSDFIINSLCSFLC